MINDITCNAMELFFVNVCNGHIIFYLYAYAVKLTNFFLHHNLNKCSSYSDNKEMLTLPSLE